MNIFPKEITDHIYAYCRQISVDAAYKFSLVDTKTKEAASSDFEEIGNFYERIKNYTFTEKNQNHYGTESGFFHGSFKGNDFSLILFTDKNLLKNVFEKVRNAKSIEEYAKMLPNQELHQGDDDFTILFELEASKSVICEEVAEIKVQTESNEIIDAIIQWFSNLFKKEETKTHTYEHTYSVLKPELMTAKNVQDKRITHLKVATHLFMFKKFLEHKKENP